MDNDEHEDESEEFDDEDNKLEDEEANDCEQNDLVLPVIGVGDGLLLANVTTISPLTNRLQLSPYRFDVTLGEHELHPFWKTKNGCSMGESNDTFTRVCPTIKEILAIVRLDRSCIE